MRLNISSVRAELKGYVAQKWPSISIHRENAKAAILDEGNIFRATAGAVDGVWTHSKNLSGPYGKKLFHHVNLKSPNGFFI